MLKIDASFPPAHAILNVDQNSATCCVSGLGQAIHSIVILLVSLIGGFAINVSVGWGYVGHNLWAGWTFEGGVRHGARIALSGWQSCRCLAACPDTPCGVQMAEWKPKDMQHTALRLMVEGNTASVCSHLRLLDFSVHV